MIDPATISGRVLDLDASTLGLADGVSVHGWLDGSGTCAVASSGTAPIYRTNVRGTRPGVRFNGTGGLTISGAPALSGATGWTVFWALSPLDVGGGHYGNILAQGSSIGFWIFSGELDGYFGGDHLSNNMSLGAPQVMAASVDVFGNLTFYRDGVAGNTYPALSPTFTPDGLGIDNGDGEAFSGDLLHLVAFNTPLTADQIRGVSAFLSGGSLAAPSYASTVLSTYGLQYYWRLDETSGTAAADLMNTNPGTYQGGYTLDQPGAVRGDVAATFNGSSGYVSTTTNVASPGPLAPFTLECWFKTTSSAGGHLLTFADAQTGIPSNDDRMMYVGTDGKVYFGIYPSAFVVINSTAAYNDGAWHHAVGVLAADNSMTLYVDGALVASNSNTSAPQIYAGWWRLGASSHPDPGWTNSGASWFSGTLDEVAIYDTALPTATVQEHYYAADPFGRPVTLTVNDAVTCRAGDVLELWVFTDQPVQYVNLAGKGATAAAASGASLFSDDLRGVSNYFSVEHVSPF